MGKPSQKVALITIGGTSHTCLAAASVIALELSLENIDRLSKMEHIGQERLDNSQQYQDNVEVFWTPIHKPIENALFMKHSANILPSKDSNSNCVTNIIVLGGGALCFSFGTYYSPAMQISITFEPTITQSYSPLTSLSTLIKEVNLVSLTPMSVESQEQVKRANVQKTAQAAGQQINHPKHINRQKQQQQQQQQQRVIRDNHSVQDISKNIKGVPQQCSVCGEEFVSKNQLHKHITISGHKKRNVTSA
jgi:hypothetical protein